MKNRCLFPEAPHHFLHPTSALPPRGVGSTIHTRQLQSMISTHIQAWQGTRKGLDLDQHFLSPATAGPPEEGAVDLVVLTLVDLSTVFECPIMSRIFV
jgi:hypothetical protein